ncbi:MAG: hypothetical protein HY000_19320, partial [Planctomycetes bacterium]|nr:hypothetical protein [Planctomycetota bacterium]
MPIALEVVPMLSLRKLLDLQDWRLRLRAPSGRSHRSPNITRRAPRSTTIHRLLFERLEDRLLLAKTVLPSITAGTPAPSSHSLTLNGSAADDRVSIDLAAGVVTGAVGGIASLGGVEQLTVNGSGATGGDTINVIGLGSPTSLETITITANGNAGDTLVVVGTAGPDTINFSATSASAGKLTILDDALVLTYANLTGTLTVDGGASGFDVLMVLGTEAADIVATPSGASVTLAGTINFNPTIDRLDILTLGGDDIVTLIDGIIVPVIVDAGTGIDFVDASEAATGVTIRGGDGDDILTGGGFSDWIDGGRGNDLVEGGPGTDTVLGGEGDDSISGGTEDDQIFAGDGSDQIAWATGEGSDLVVGEDGSDVLQFTIDSGSITASASGVRVQLTDGEATLSIAGTEQLELVEEWDFTGPVTINDLFGTGVRRVNVDVADRELDTITVNGRSIADNLSIT